VSQVDVKAIASLYGFEPPRQLGEFPLPVADATQRPVFVLGAARSGTSAMAQGLLKSGEFQGFEEGHLLWILRCFLDTIDAFYASNGEDASPNRFTMLAHTPYTYLADAARAGLVAAIANMFPQGRWVDKTPRREMIGAARLMQELWPNARFVFMKRRGIENILSRIHKFPQISFQEHCIDWATSMEAWLRIRDLLSSSAIEVEQLAMVESPHTVASQVGTFIGMSALGGDNLTRSLQEDHPERTSNLGDKPRHVSDLGWSIGWVTEFRRICGPMMAAFGYSYTESYFAKPVASVTI
jgi:hypothetical protein